MTDAAVITSVSNPRVKRLVRLRKPRERRAAGVLIAEGRREVERALAAGLELLEVWACEQCWFSAGEMSRGRGFVDSLRSPRLQEIGGVTWVSDSVMQKVAYHAKPEGVLAVFETPAWGLDELPVKENGLYLVAVGTEKPGNLGAMVRTAAVAGCDAVLAVGPAVDVFNPNAIRNSTGAVFALPTIVVEPPEAIQWLRGRGVTIAAAMAEGGTDCFTTDWAGPPMEPKTGETSGGVAVVIGPEHAGLDDRWRDAADVRLTIPATVGIVDSLNASNAAAVLLFEAVRQRRGKSKSA